MTPKLKRTLIITCLIVVGVFIISIANQSRKHAAPDFTDLAERGLVVLSKPRAMSQFTLLDQDGADFGPEDFKGHWSVIFFGFTHCPDICPTTLSTLRQSLDKMEGSIRDKFKIYLASADPERDTPAVIKTYVRAFSPDFLGLTGQHADLARFSQQVNVTFAKVPIRLSQQHQGHAMGGDMGQMTDQNNYTIDHSTQLIILNPMGHFHAFLKPPHRHQDIALFLEALQQRFRFSI